MAVLLLCTVALSFVSEYTSLKAGKVVKVSVAVSHTERKHVSHVPHPAPNTQLPQDLEDAARYQLYAAYGAYCTAKQLMKWDCKWCKKIGLAKVYGVATKVSHDGQAFVIRNNASQIIVSFRGSHNIPNWISDFTFDKVELKWAGVPSGIKVHQGFLKGYEAMQDDVKTWVAEAVKDCPKCTVHVTGHSLGAAEAVLCVTDLRLQGYKPEMWNFGLPRVGDEKFAEWFDNTTKANDQTVYRMVERHDVVPHLPMHQLGFRHIALEVWHKGTASNTYTVCDGTGEDKKCSRSLRLLQTNAIDHLVCLLDGFTNKGSLDRTLPCSCFQPSMFLVDVGEKHVLIF